MLRILYQYSSECSSVVSYNVPFMADFAFPTGYHYSIVLGRARAMWKDEVFGEEVVYAGRLSLGMRETLFG